MATSKSKALTNSKKDTQAYREGLHAVYKHNPFKHKRGAPKVAQEDRSPDLVAIEKHYKAKLNK